jgi:hypothetical protein
MASQIDLMVDVASNSLPYLPGGKIKAYAVTANIRLASAPDIPTVDEAGLPGFHISTWYGLFDPKAMPMDVLAKLNAATVSALADSAVVRRLADLGLAIPPREQQTPEALATLQRAEIEKWWPISRRPTSSRSEAAHPTSAPDAVDGSSTGTRVRLKWALLGHPMIRRSRACKRLRLSVLISRSQFFRSMASMQMAT